MLHWKTDWRKRWLNKLKMSMLILKQRLLTVKLETHKSWSRAQPTTIISLLLVDTTRAMKASHRSAPVYEPSTSWCIQIRTRILYLWAYTNPIKESIGPISLATRTIFAFNWLETRMKSAIGIYREMNQVVISSVIKSSLDRITSWKTQRSLS